MQVVEEFESTPGNSNRYRRNSNKPITYEETPAGQKPEENHAQYLTFGKEKQAMMTSNSNMVSPLDSPERSPLTQKVEEMTPLTPN